MEQLREVVNRTADGLADMEHEAKDLLSDLYHLGARLKRAFDAALIDATVNYLDIERRRMLEEEARAETNASLAAFPALGIYGLFSLFSGRKPNWGRAVSVAFPKEPFEDVRVAVSEDNIRLVNVSKMARERDMTVAGVVAYLEEKGNKVLTWSGFEAWAKNLRMAALKGEVTLLSKEETKLQLKSHDPPRLVSTVI